MIDHNKDERVATPDNPAKRQVNDKTPRKVQLRSGQGTSAYWKARLFRNTYRDRNGKTIEIPEYYVRMRFGGVTKRVRLASAEKDRAAEEALRLSERLAAEGWSVVESGLARMPASPSIEDFCGAYTKAVARMENPPRPISVALYLRHLRKVCALSGVTRLRELTPDAIEKSRDRYRAEGRADRRDDVAIQNSMGIMIRNAAACFSVDARAILERMGLALENPFLGVKRTQRIEPVTAMPRELVAALWAKLPLLRDGDPDAGNLDLATYRKAYRAAHGGNHARWLPVDYRKPHPEAYCAILLALGLGLRANEIDKARWSWLQFTRDGACILSVRKEADFEPKGGTSRQVRVPVELYDQLTQARVDKGSPYILGGYASEAVESNGWGYRCRETLRVASSWLRSLGIEADDIRGNPLHRLRKQFGSEVATGYGLFAAQKLLGHASPVVTAKYYAAQTDLPELKHVRIAG